jgi:hypothetical protein
MITAMLLLLLLLLLVHAVLQAMPMLLMAVVTAR